MKLKKILLSLVLAFAIFGLVACKDTAAAAKTDTTELENKIADVEAKQSELTETIASLEQQLQEAKEALETEKEALEAKVAELEAKIAELERIVKGKFYIRVVDIDGEELVNDSYDVVDYTSVYECIVANYENVIYDGEYGHSVASIAGSVIDNNWYLASYENGAYATTGIDGLVIDTNDTFEWISECWNTKASGWGTMDEYDVEVDVTVYHYLKTYAKEAIANCATYTGSYYWEHAALSKMHELGYDKTDFTASEELVASLQLSEENMAKLSGNNIMKYYFASKFVGNLAENDAFKNRCTSLFETSVSEWQLPVAKYYGIDNDATAKIYNSDTYNTSWGTDTAVWSYCLRALYRDNRYIGEGEDNPVMAKFQTTTSFANGASQALILLAYAKDGADARSFKLETSEGSGVYKDVLENLFDNYYDSELKLVKWKMTDASTNMSTNQIYAGLMMYKACRDLGNPVNLFA